VQRFTSLATLFYLLSFVMYIKARGLDSSKKAGYLFYAMSIISAVLAMRTKEIAFTLPVMIILYEWMFFKGDVRRRLLYIFPFLLTLPIIPLTLMGLKDTPAGFGGIDEITRITGIGLLRWDYLNTQFRVIVTYIRLLFFPVNQNLDYDYPLYRSFFNPEVLLSFLFLLAFFGMGIYLLYKSYRAEQGKRFWLRLVSLGILWFFVTLSVESSIIPISDLIFEHRLYLPSVGFFMALLSGIILIKENWASRVRIVEKALIPVMISVVIGLSVAAYARNMVWQDEGTLWADVIKKSPNKARSHYNLGLFYQDQGRLDDAINAYETAIKLKPDDAKAFYNLAICYEKQGRLDDAIKANQTAINLKPDDAKAHYNMGVYYQKMGRFDDAITAYKTVVAFIPDYADAHYNLGMCYQSLERFVEAIQAYQTVKKLNPGDAEIYNNLGALYRKQGRFDDAIKAYQTAIKLKPDYAEGHYNQGLFYHKQGRLDDAIKAYEAAIKLKPDYADAHNNLGGAYFVQGHLEEASREFHAALKIDPNHKDARTNLEALDRIMKNR
jgi:tetratricopeptide (TPR) repeat protein